LLASLGADVVKVEDPLAGDYMRSFGAQVDGQGATHWLVNRSKRSIVVDLKRAEGRDVFLRLVDGADVLVESFRPHVMDRLGLGFDALRARQPRPVQVSLSGYGRTGPLVSEAGHDLNYLAVAGLLERLGAPGTSPVVPPIPLADLLGGGLLPALGAVSLVLAARQTGRGAHLDASLTEGISLLPNLVVADLLAGAEQAGRGETAFGGGLACYRVYALRDGFVAVGAVEERFFVELVEKLDLAHLAPHQLEPDRQDEIAAALEVAFATRSRSDVEREFAGSDACVTVVRSYEEMLGSDVARARGYLRDSPGTPLQVLAPPFVIDGSRPPESAPAPRQGENGREVLAESGFTEAEIDELTTRRVAGFAPPQHG
jgi:crotonobetainyl-CoA:carnitine CoA-transferase CaiB-like acyl-CoA transferase